MIAIGEFRRRLIELAAENADYMHPLDEQESFQFVEQVIAKYKIVFGVWQDRSSGDGVGIHIIKGRKDLEPVLQAKTFVDISAIPCFCQEQATAAEKFFGNEGAKLM
jgi:hypothetical protein